MKKTIFALIVLNILAFFALRMVVAVAPAAPEPDPVPTHSENKQFIRLHVRANSDSESDQALKLKVRDGILDYTTRLLSGVTDKEEAMTLVRDNLSGIESAADSVVTENGFSYPVIASLKEEYFEYREYDGFYLPADVYDSLIVNVGSGEGHNWWCVIFPAVCLSGSSGQPQEEEKTGETVSSASPGDPFEEESVAASAAPSVRVDQNAVPESYRLGETPAPKEVKFDFWLVKVFRDLFGKEK